MSEERRKINKQYTGTVPKVKYRNNTSFPVNDQETSQTLSNNLSRFWRQPTDSANFIRNSRNPRNNYFAMDVGFEQQHLQPVQNTASNANSVPTPNTSSSTSRRNSSSSTLKCDNVTKYPDKKQIEDKLSQIREYLQITSSLMNGFKNTEDQAEKNNLQQMFNDLKDSEKKLIKMLDETHEPEIPAESAPKFDIQIVENGADNFSESAITSRRNDVDVNNLDNQVGSLREQQFALLRLQQKAENRLKDVKKAQDMLLVAQFGNNPASTSTQKDNKNMSLSDFDVAIKELEDRAKGLKQPTQQNTNFSDKILCEVETLHNRIVGMHQANNDREQLIEALDNRDSELRSQQAELQTKLAELQNKKQQIDQLVVQLQTIDDEEQDDVGGQVRKIVTMKDQLKKLKDMLEIVKNTENVMQNTNYSPEAEAAACDICTTAENFLQNEIQKPRSSNDSNVVLRYENDMSSENRQKQVNKTQRGSKQRTSSINEKLALQAELEAKKKELEDIMGKHKAGTSNLNHDVGADSNKSEFSCAGNSVNERTYWRPLLPLQNQDDAASDRFSSEEDEYSELHDNQNILPAPSVNYPPSNASKQRSEHADYVFPMERFHGVSQTPERNVRSSSVATSGYFREQPRSNATQDKLQKQLKLIKSVCDSMLEQQNTTAPPPTQQLRNNLTPSPYSEPNQHTLNAINVLNGNTDIPWYPGSGGATDLNNYHSWLTTNTLQTQSFMMNTLNQCCQMLWLQQRELVSLRNTVSMLQERIDNPQSTPLPQVTPIDQSRSNQYRPGPSHKHNQPVASACSLPNLNHYNAAPTNYSAPPLNNYHAPTNSYNAHPSNYNAPPSNLEMPYANLNNSRLLDPCLNNITQGVENNVLHANINQSMPMWNGQALNNQVAPGNRANNYWDNFRSYSRQNLLSTKSNDVYHNTPSTVERSNQTTERTNPFALMSFAKSNSDSGNTSQEHTPQRRMAKATPLFENSNGIPPPDVLNVNHNVKTNATSSGDDVNLGYVSLYGETVVGDCNVEEEPNEGGAIRTNEWSGGEEREQKSKLFEELRDNVYKEVASLISANEARPHFLIQLFRDLQMIASDSLRLKTLQSIQSVVTHSNRQSIDSQQSDSLQENFSLQSTVWSKPAKNYSLGPRNVENDESDIHNAFTEIVPFLNEHESENVNGNFLLNLRQSLLNSDSFKEVVKDTIFQKHFSNVLDEVLEQYRGKKVRDVKSHLIQTVTDLLSGELSFIQLIQETNPDNCHDDVHPHITFTQPAAFDGQHENVPMNQNGDCSNIQNADLAEADQSRVIDDDAEEEGAVGGVLDVDVEGRDVTHGNSEEILSLGTMDFPCSSEGLDQVPTRLPTKIKSRSTTPNKDGTNSRTEPDSF